MKEHPILYTADMVRAWFAGTKTQTRRLAVGKNGKPSHWTKAQSGDVLCGRETIWFDDGMGHIFEEHETPSVSRFVNMEKELLGKELPAKTTPSIHMPRWASRISQKVVSVRIERLQDISSDDAIAEGILQSAVDGVGRKLWKIYGLQDTHSKDPELSYKSLWGSVYGADSWAANPKVVVIEFGRYRA